MSKEVNIARLKIGYKPYQNFDKFITIKNSYSVPFDKQIHDVYKKFQLLWNDPISDQSYIHDVLHITVESTGKQYG